MMNVICCPNDCQLIYMPWCVNIESKRFTDFRHVYQHHHANQSVFPVDICKLQNWSTSAFFFVPVFNQTNKQWHFGHIRYRSKLCCSTVLENYNCCAINVPWHYTDNDDVTTKVSYCFSDSHATRRHFFAHLTTTTSLSQNYLFFIKRRKFGYKFSASNYLWCRFHVILQNISAQQEISWLLIFLL